MKTPYLKTALFCLISAVACGLLNALRCGDPLGADSSCPISALSVVSETSFGWPSWLDWINWIPGLVFGVLWALSAISWRESPARPRIIRFALLSGLVYMLAGPLFSWMLVLNESLAGEGVTWLLPGGFVAGLFGAAGLATSLALQMRGSHPAAARIGWMIVTAAVGAVAGLAFVTTAFYSLEFFFVGWPIAFVLWQVPVGLSLTAQLGRSPAASAISA